MKGQSLFFGEKIRKKYFKCLLPILLPSMLSDNLFTCILAIWAAPFEKGLSAAADSEVQDLSAHPCSLIRAFAIRKQNHWIL